MFTTVWLEYRTQSSGGLVRLSKRLVEFLCSVHRTISVVWPIHGLVCCHNEAQHNHLTASNLILNSITSGNLISCFASVIYPLPPLHLIFSLEIEEDMPSLICQDCFMLHFTTSAFLWRFFCLCSHPHAHVDQIALFTVYPHGHLDFTQSTPVPSPTFPATLLAAFIFSILMKGFWLKCWFHFSSH